MNCLPNSQKKFIGVLIGLFFICAGQSIGQIRSNWFDINPSSSNLDASNPNGSSGGRIQHLGASSTLGRIYAASEWGGLWTSFNQGLSWVKVNSFVPSATWDVKVDPRNAERIYVTSFFDGRANARIRRSLSGISISNDAGNSWTNAPLPAGVICAVASRQNEPSAWQIAINPNDPTKVFVGTNCGLARSFDSGGTWDYVDPSPANNAEQIYAVIAHGNNFVDVIGDNGHFRSNNDGAAGSWTTVTSGAGLPGGISSIAVSPAENYVLFATVNQNVFESDDGGQTWPTSILTPPGNRQGRIPFVKTNQLITSNQFDLWFGDVSLFRTTATTPTPPASGGTQRATNNWVNTQNGAHNDVADLLFDPRFTAGSSPLLFANDGGVYRNLITTSPASQTPLWEQPQVTPHATWLFGFDGTQMAPGTHAIYYGLQDNGSWGTINSQEGPASPVPNWNNEGCCDAFDDASQTDLIVFTRGFFSPGRGFRLFRKGANFSGGGFGEIPNYPSAGTIGGFKAGREVVRFGNNAFALALSDGVYITNNINSTPISWTSLNAPSLPGGSNVGGLKVASTPRELTSIYYHTGSGNPNGQGQIFRRAVTGTGGWQQLPLPTAVVGGAGINITGVTVYDVDPNNGNSLIISGIDAFNNFSMWRTTDYGTNWTQLNGLDNLMVGNGAFVNRTNQGPTNFTGFGTYWQPYMVEFNPNDGNTVVAGAADAGVFLTTDLGNNWQLISNPNDPTSASPHIPRPLFAHFSPVRFTPNSSAFDVWIGTQGAGVVKVLVESP